jgi:cell division protein FtsW
MTALDREVSPPEKTEKKRRWITRMPRLADRSIHISLMFLAVYGLLMIASASMGLAIGRTGYLAFVVIKQAVFLLGGYLAMAYLANKFSLSLLKGSFPMQWGFFMTIALLLCLLFPETNGARAWIRLPVSSFDISIQPSEFAKVLAPLIIASYCGDVKVSPANPHDLWTRPLIFISIFLVMILVQSDLGSAVVLGLISALCFLVPHHPDLKRFQHVLLFLLLTASAFVIYLLTPAGESFIELLPLRDYQKNRFISAINPFADQYDTGYQLINGLVSFASGGWLGLGFGNSVRKYTDFPAANTDFILAIVVEEMGIIGFLLIFIPYLIIVVQIFRYALSMRSEKARIILVGTAMYLVIHCLFNIGGVTGLIPLTGVPLLMISSGGSSTLSFMVAVGIAQAVISQYRRGLIQ